ncbi:hypothetical protein GCM10010402_20680 [Actinomadura luteofluorescens]
MHSHQETFPSYALFSLIQLPHRCVMFPLRPKRTRGFPQVGQGAGRECRMRVEFPPARPVYLTSDTPNRTGATPQANGDRLAA